MTTPDAEPTTKEERDDMLKRRGKHTDRLLYGPKTMMGRLIADVEWLREQVERATMTDPRLCEALARALREAGLVIEALTGSETHPGTKALARWDEVVRSLHTGEEKIDGCRC